MLPSGSNPLPKIIGHEVFLVFGTGILLFFDTMLSRVWGTMLLLVLCTIILLVFGTAFFARAALVNVSAEQCGGFLN